MSKLINGEELANAIKDVEDVLKDYDAEESSLVLNKVNERRRKASVKTGVSDMINDMPFSQIFRKVRKNDTDNVGEDTLM